MAAVGDLINKGFILDQQSEEKGRTFIVTGLYRSGTSLVASVLQRAGLFIGSDINDIVYQDEEIFRVLAAGRIEALPPIIGARNADHRNLGLQVPDAVASTHRQPVATVRRPSSDHHVP